MYHVLRMQVVHGVRNVDSDLDPQRPTQLDLIVFQFCLKITARDKLRYNINTYTTQHNNTKENEVRECARVCVVVVCERVQCNRVRKML